MLTASSSLNTKALEMTLATPMGDERSQDDTKENDDGGRSGMPRLAASGPH